MSDCQNWIAWIDRRPRGTPVVRVQGDCQLPVGALVSLRRPRAPVADASAPVVRGPEIVARDGPPPVFKVDPGPDRYYALEIAADPSLFRAGTPSTPSLNTLYTTWQAGDLLADQQTTLAQDAWDGMRDADYLFYRVVTSSSQNRWSLTASSDAGTEPGQAPLFAIVGSMDGLDSSDRLVLVRIVSLPQSNGGGQAVVRAVYAENTPVVYRFVTILPDGVSMELDQVF